MTYEINETHDQNLKSWVESANAPDTDFPIQNLPFCIFRSKAIEQVVAELDENYFDKIAQDIAKQLDINLENKEISDDDFSNMMKGVEEKVGSEQSDNFAGIVGVAIGDQVFDLENSIKDGLFESASIPLLSSLTIPKGAVQSKFFFRQVLFFTRPETFSKLRKVLIQRFQASAPKETQDALGKYLYPISEITFALPAKIGDYTDFYCSIYHATNVGKLFRPDNPLMPNYKWIPIGYHGRASSIVVSGQDVVRPKGQNHSKEDAPPVYIPSKALDYEMEVGFFVGKGNNLGETIDIKDAEEHIFGLCLVNDWSARDIQGWEYQPLGPFLGKSFATTVSPFVVTMEALAPFRVPAFERDSDDPQPLEYLADEQNQKFGGLDIKLDVYLQTEKMRAENIEPHLLSRSNPKDLYWTIGQMLTHHASNGCNLQTGDLMATGTVSGKEDNERGCLLEMTKRGAEPVTLPSGETRKFLEDGDEIIMKGFCEREGYRRIGFGECRGKVLPVT